MIQRTWRRLLPARLHGQLILLVLAVIVPALALLAGTLLEHHRDRLDLAEEEAARLAEAAVRRQERLVQDTQHLLRTLAALPQVSEGDEEACRRLFSNILLGSPSIAYLGAVDRDENRIVVAPSEPAGFDWEGAPWLDTALAQQGVVSSISTLGPTISTQQLICAYPLIDQDPRRDRVLFAAIPLETFVRPDLDGRLIERACLLLLDENCSVVARHPDCEHGMDACLAPIDPVQLDTTPCVLTAGKGDREVIFQISPFRGPADHPLYVGIGLPKDLFAESTGPMMIRGLAIMAFVAIAVLFVARRIAFRYVLHPIERLLDTATRLRSGEYSARTAFRSSASELAELARSFNDLAASLEQRRADRERALGDLRESEARHAAVIDAAIDGIITMDGDGRIVRMNPAAEEMFRRHSDEVAGKPISKVILARSFCTLDKSSPAERPSSHLLRFETGRFESLAVRSDRVTFPVEIAVTPIQYVQGQALLTAYIRDISRQKEHEETLRNLSLADELTGLHNRRGFTLFAEQQLRNAERMGSWAWLLFADMNDLKEINDQFGHSEGDRALIAFGEILRKTFRRSDVLSRIGGDEFAILALDRRRRGAEGMIRRLQREISASNRRGERAYPISISVGYAQFEPESPTSLEELLAEGDAMMYEQKRAARSSGLSPLSSILEDLQEPPPQT